MLLRLSPPATEGLGQYFFWASIISTVGHSFLTCEHLNTPMVLEGCWNGVKKEIGGPNRPHDAQDAGPGGLLGA